MFFADVQFELTRLWSAASVLFSIKLMLIAAMWVALLVAALGGLACGVVMARFAMSAATLGLLVGSFSVAKAAFSVRFLNDASGGLGDCGWAWTPTWLAPAGFMDRMFKVCETCSLCTGFSDPLLQMFECCGFCIGFTDRLYKMCECVGF